MKSAIPMIKELFIGTELAFERALFLVSFQMVMHCTLIFFDGSTDAADELTRIIFVIGKGGH